ncbi:hypothetical protein [Desulfoluna butyratoxydans]|uniref:Uncharacterized protein n=1 Tax=Desulfoluna butyratoxydans TaxID=231438 RepID=A0A4U8YJH1_9BACT|nr:hypothetical protein [Desulfoluna butyratoxydans]VFQ43906.1 hypothetical protein MSL71_15490 [Desulfoluna butyratoxydans]
METHARKQLELRKKAAISAVLTLLATEQAEETEPVVAERSNAWGLSGRSQSMELRNLMQLRSLGRR